MIFLLLYWGTGSHHYSSRGSVSPPLAGTRTKNLPL